MIARVLAISGLFRIKFAFRFVGVLGGRVIQYIFMKDVVAGAALRVSVSRHEHRKPRLVR